MKLLRATLLNSSFKGITGRKKLSIFLTPYVFIHGSFFADEESPLKFS